MGLLTLDAESALQQAVALYPTHITRIKYFLQNCVTTSYAGKPDGGFWSNYPYMRQLQQIYDRRSRQLVIELKDLRLWCMNGKDADLWEALVRNTPRYMQLIYAAADSLLQEGAVDFEEYRLTDVADPKRIEYVVEEAEVLREEYMKNGFVPPDLRANYDIRLIPSDGPADLEHLPVLSVRGVDASRIGGLSRMKADIVRVGPVKPRIRVAAYECDYCHKHCFQGVPGASYLPLFDCPGCLSSLKYRGSLKLNTKLSKFDNYQEIKIQEPVSQIPDGDIPRSMTCIAHGENVRILQPGMTAILTGVLLPVEKFGYAALRSGLVSEQRFIIYHIQDEKNVDPQDAPEFDVSQELEELLTYPNLYEKLASELAPEIYGLLDVKKALLLQLVGGCRQIKSDGGFVRGDIHVLLMGDPGVAKSQLMKRCCFLAPRGVYATGCGSSKAGLTAAVVKDPVTGETSLEGGALILADRGLCCIDEFDKMEEYDRSAIYEAMEQQSVSIAKAGHCCNLPARASVLAAANPIKGRYDPRRPILANINLPAALLTRFDLIFLLVDKIDRVADLKLARHVMGVMRDGINYLSKNKPIHPRLLRALIHHCQSFEPELADGLAESIANWYSMKRKQERIDESVGEDVPTYSTPRALLAILRLSQALARLRSSLVIEEADFEEAIRLSEASKASVKAAGDNVRRRRLDRTSQVFDIVKRLKARYASRKSWSGWIHLTEIRQQTAAAGIPGAILDDSFNQYVELGVLIWNCDKTAIGFPDDIHCEEVMESLAPPRPIPVQ